MKIDYETFEYAKRVVRANKSLLKEFFNNEQNQELLYQNDYDALFTKYFMNNGVTQTLTCLFLLSEIDFLSSMSYIPTQCFISFPFKTFIVPNSIQTIKMNAFAQCEELTMFTLPTSVKSLDRDLFIYCSKLTNIKYEGTVSQWYNIIRSDNWARNSQITEVHCADGVITL